MKRPPYLKKAELQLIWGATLSYIKANPQILETWTTPVEPEKFYESVVWKETINSLDALRELREVGGFVVDALRDNNTKYAYARPGAPTQYDPQRNRIAINFIDSMISGFEHTRAMAMREVGKALHSRVMPERMQELQKVIFPLMRKARAAKEKKNGVQLTAEEYKTYQLSLIEFNLRDMLYQAAEKNMRNRFAAKRGEVKQQDFSVSLNHSAVPAESRPG